MEYTIQGIKIRFPFEAYPLQQSFMDKVMSTLNEKTHALLESPTGTGKTLCLLIATLAWREHYLKLCAARRPVEIKYENQRGRPTAPSTGETIDDVGPRIFYTSRTHSQLSQVVRELKRSGYKVKSAVIGSRDHLCLLPEVRNQPSHVDQTRLCRRKVATRTCPHHSTSDKIKLSEGILDIEEVVQYAKERHACPFFVSRNSIKDAVITFLPYNYLLDPDNRRQQNIDLNDAIVIFDEAHNLESTCTESASTSFSHLDLINCAEEVRLCIDIVARGMTDKKPSTFKGLFDTFNALAFDLKQLSLMGNSRIEPGSFIFDFLAKQQVTWNSISAILEGMVAAMDLIVADFNAHRRSKGGLSTVSRALGTIFREEFRYGINSFMQYFRVHIVEEPTGSQRKMDRVVNFWCLHSSVAMKDLIKQNVRSCILASGTLSPMNSFEQEMGISFAHVLENAHVIDPSQILVGIVPSGPRNIQLSSAYSSRSNYDYQVELGNTVHSIAQLVPRGLLGFFPSYSAMEGLLVAWKTAGILDRIETLKRHFVEPKDRRQFPPMIESYEACCQERGAALFGVCRGKISEGIDFADNKGRAALILGIPYPNFKDPRVDLKKHFLDDRRKVGLGSLSGAEWYIQQASRAVNQAIGRVVRHRNDYGAILLIDERFGGPNIRQELSKWVRPHVKLFHDFKRLKTELSQFYAHNESVRPYVAPESLPGVGAVQNTLNIGGFPRSGSLSRSTPHRVVKKNEYRECGAAIQRLPSLLSKYASAQKRKMSLIVDAAPSFKRPRLGVIETCATSTKATPVRDAVMSYNVPQDMTLHSARASSANPKDYKVLLREHLKENSETFQRILRSFKDKSISAEDMMESVLQLFATTQCKELFSGFAAYVPREHKRSWVNMYSSYFRNQSASSIAAKGTSEDP